MWEELAIEPTSDSKAVRRAYAAKLKTLNPDNDPVAFQKLRAAYEQALRYASSQTKTPRQAGSGNGTEDNRVHADVSVAETGPAPEQPAPSPEELERVEAERELNFALKTGDPKRALRALTTALARGVVQLGHKEYLLDAIMSKVVQDKSLSPEEYRDIMREAGWSVLPGVREPISRVRQAAIARGEAEAWFIHLRKIASERMDGAARLLLFGKPRIFLTATDLDPLGYQLAQYDRHKDWLPDRFNQDTIARAKRIYNSGKAWLKARDIIVACIFALLALLCVAAVFVAPAAGFGAFLFGRLAANRFRALGKRRRVS